MAMVTIEDQHGQIDGVIFSDAYAEYADLLTDHAMLFLIGSIDRSQGAPSVRVDRVVAMDNAAAQLSGSLEISVQDDDDVEATLSMLTGELSRGARLNGSQGKPVPVRVHLHTQGQHIIIEPNRLRVTPTESLMSAIRELVGEHGCEVTGAPVKAM
jgi:DNA polymerase III alpha subunit